MVNRKRLHPISGGFVLLEMLVVLAIIALMTSIAMLSFTSLSGKSYFQKKAGNLVSVFQSAWSAAQQSDRRYEVLLNFQDKTWILREKAPLVEETTEQDMNILKGGYFEDRFQLDYVLYDDGLDTRTPRQGEITTVAALIAGHGGWQYGGKVVLRDEDGNPWSIVLYRIGKPVELVPGDVDILLIQDPRDMTF